MKQLRKPFCLSNPSSTEDSEDEVEELLAEGIEVYQSKDKEGKTYYFYEKDSGKELVIFAGACQSFYEAIMMAGANFASSPARIMIDFFDPLVIAEKIATTDYMEYITMSDLEDKLRDGKKRCWRYRSLRKTTCNICVTQM